MLLLPTSYAKLEAMEVVFQVTPEQKVEMREKIQPHRQILQESINTR